MPQISTKISSNVSYRKMGSGPCLVLIHGFPESGNLWRDTWSKLSDTFTLIIPDMPGSGNSQLDSETSIGGMAECVKAIMDAEDIEKAVIAGHSMGGYIGFEFAARYPHMVAGLSLVHSVPDADDEEKKIMRSKSIQLLRNGGKDIYIRQMIPNLFSEASKKLHPAMVEEEIGLALQMDDQCLINFTRAMMERKDNAGLLAGANFPMQWIIGKDDNVINFRKILKHTYQSRINFVSFYANCGHMSMLESPDRLLSDLKKFTNYSFGYN
jgi:pimeloyl-ACP methyl ester carboxylesterase